ncbi:hypothetical protein ARALYDRAFT_915592 [Arabidopsis lyrata subsp. lyrata]|uniref:Uncharacterized protein n=1 Tax=Arabidopsis lyrata subsp. lyrata TaxID=81972 RepID=D7MHI3_ARALL|nr:hypothetical protein ARALYDRAFT_915592 [Arabidopsis lyrata subsp. lyrata]
MVLTVDMVSEINAESRVLFDTNPLKPLGDLLEREGLLTQSIRIQQEFKSGEEYWALERKLCLFVMLFQ